MEAKIRNLHGQQNPSPSSQQNPAAQIQQNPPQGKRNPPPAKQNHLHAKQIPPKKAMPRNPQEQKNVVKEEAKRLQKGPRG